MVTAVNPKTGERVELINGQWVPAGKGGAQASGSPKPRPEWGVGAYELPDGSIWQRGPRGGTKQLQGATQSADAPKLAEYQVNAAGRATLMDEGERAYSEARKQGYDPASPTNAMALGLENTWKVGPYLADWVRDDASERGRAAELQFVEGALRTTTGANAPEPEVRRASRMYFRQPGEGPTVEPNKARVRQRFRDTAVRAAGAAYIPEPSSTAPDRPAGWTRALPRPQRAALSKYYGTKEKPGSEGNPFVPRNAAEFKRFPSGSFILDDDGTVFRKP